MPLNSQAVAFLRAVRLQNPPPWEDLTPLEARARFASLKELYGEPVPVAAVADQGRLRIYHPSGEGPFPAVVYIHGGGWVLGDRETHDALCRRLTVESGCVVVSVDYSRAPEARFPQPIEECLEAVIWVVQQAEELKVDAGRIAVAGDSAGGNLAAATALLARERGGPAIRFQLLIYPVLDRDFETESYRKFAVDHGLTRPSMQWFWSHYLADEADGENPLAAPLKAGDLAGLPAAHVMTAEYDVLRDEGEAYAARLQGAGVATTLKRYEGVLHGFMHLLGVFDLGAEALRDAGRVLRERLG